MNQFGRRSAAVLLALALTLSLTAPLAMAQSFAEIRGVLLDAEGLPLSGYQIGLRSDSGDLFLSAPTAADASFSLSQLPPDRYRLVAFDPKGVEFPVLSNEVLLQGGQVERIEVRLGSPEGAPPGRTPAAPAQASGGVRGFWGNLPLWGKVAIVTAGAFAVYTAVDDDDDDDSASPSQP